LKVANGNGALLQNLTRMLTAARCDFLTPPFSTILGDCQLFASDLGFVLQKVPSDDDWPIKNDKNSRIESKIEARAKNQGEELPILCKPLFLHHKFDTTMIGIVEDGRR
jgi:hypothetical protein